MSEKYWGTENPKNQIWENISLNLTKGNIKKNLGYEPNTAQIESKKYFCPIRFGFPAMFSDTTHILYQKVSMLLQTD